MTEITFKYLEKGSQYGKAYASLFDVCLYLPEQGVNFNPVRAFTQLKKAKEIVQYNITLARHILWAFMVLFTKTYRISSNGLNYQQIKVVIPLKLILPSFTKCIMIFKRVCSGTKKL